MVSTLGAVILAVGFLIFIYNIARSWKKGEIAGSDPWDGRTLEWSIPSPPPEYNFVEIPDVQDRDDWWEEKQRRREPAAIPVIAGGSDSDSAHDIHLPQPSYWPFFVSLGLFIGGMGLVYLINVSEAGIRTLNYVALTTTVVGVIIGMVSVYAWSFEPVNDPEPDGELAAH